MQQQELGWKLENVFLICLVSLEQISLAHYPSPSGDLNGTRHPLSARSRERSAGRRASLISLCVPRGPCTDRAGDAERLETEWTFINGARKWRYELISSDEHHKLVLLEAAGFWWLHQRSGFIPGNFTGQLSFLTQNLWWTHLTGGWKLSGLGVRRPGLRCFPSEVTSEKCPNHLKAQFPQPLRWLVQHYLSQGLFYRSDELRAEKCRAHPDA